MKFETDLETFKHEENMLSTNDGANSSEFITELMKKNVLYRIKYVSSV